jgi:hypothetical protein
MLTQWPLQFRPVVMPECFAELGRAKLWVLLVNLAHQAGP